MEHRRRCLSNHGNRLGHEVFYVPESVAADREPWIIHLKLAPAETLKQPFSETSDKMGAAERVEARCLFSIFHFEFVPLNLFGTHWYNHTSFLNT